ncbi:MAG: hypothetical protein ABUT20_46170, partial [Bacteroidota bacterium]
MGIIQKQSIRSTIGISIGFAIGAFNLLVLQKYILTTEQLGLTRLITDLGITLATLCTLGSLPVVYKFFPFYKNHLPAEKNDLAFTSFMVCFIGFVLMCIAGYALKGAIVQKFSSKSPLFVQYSYLIYPFTLFYLLFFWLESFGWSFRKSTVSNTLREIVPRVLFSALLILVALKIISIRFFLIAFSLSYLPPAVALFITLRRTGEFNFNTTISKLTMRLKSKMISFGLFVFGAQFLNVLSKTSDTVIISSVSDKGLVDTAVFTVATYVVALMEIP